MPKKMSLPVSKTGGSVGIRSVDPTAKYSAVRVYTPYKLPNGKWCIAKGFESVAKKTKKECEEYARRNSMPLTKEQAQSNWR